MDDDLLDNILNELDEFIEDHESDTVEVENEITKGFKIPFHLSHTDYRILELSESEHVCIHKDFVDLI